MTRPAPTMWPPAPSRGTSPLAIEMRHRRSRAGIRHDDGPLCPIERQRAHRTARAFCVAGTMLAVALMLGHMAGVGL